MAISDSVKNSIIWVLTIAVAMEMLDSSILNTSLPQIALSLNINPIALKSALTVYLLSVGIFIPISGWVADRVGEKNALLFAITLFTLSSIGCGFAKNLNTLIIFRFLQGVGGAFLMPICRLIIAREFEGHAGIYAMAKITSVGMFGLVLGPLIGGALTTYMNWRWIFFVNVPLGILGWIFVSAHLPQLRERIHNHFDWLGFFLIAIGLGSLLFLFDVMVNQNISIYLKLSMLVITIAAFLLYRLHAKNFSTPLFSLKLFQQKKLMHAAAGSLFSRLTLSALAFLIPLLLQTAYGFSAIKASLYMIPTAFAIIISKSFVPSLFDKYTQKNILRINSLLIFLVVISFVIQAYTLMPALLIIQQLLIGFLMSVQFSGMNSLAYENLHEPYLSQGASLYSGVVQVSGSFGIALAALTMIAVIGPNDLEHSIPLIAFKVVFIVQALYILIAEIFFLNK